MTHLLCPTCGKQCHTRADARRQAANLRRISVSRRPIHVYKCPDCRLHRDAMFHVGHQPSRSKQGRWKPGSL